ncbi:MAG: c-type cytochrome domain-containing protein [Planctomycetota bacterium]
MKTLLLILLGFASTLGAQEPPPADDDLQLKVLDVLSTHCFSCHGPDKQKSGLRLDEIEEIESVVEPGDPALSELVRRLLLPVTDDESMPPPKESSEMEAEMGVSWERPTRAEVWSVIEWVQVGAPTDAIAAALRESQRSADQLAESLQNLSRALGARVARIEAENAIDGRAGFEIDFRFGRRLLDRRAAEAVDAIGSDIVELNLAGRELSEEFFRSLPVMPRLLHLRLERTGLEDMAIASLLAKSPALEVLNLHSTEAGPATLSALVGIRSLNELVAFDTRLPRGELEELFAGREGSVLRFDESHPDDLFPGGGPRHLLVVDPAGERLVLLRERALTHYDTVREWSVADVQALGRSGDALFVRRASGEVLELKLGQSEWRATEQTPAWSTEVVDTPRLRELWEELPDSLQSTASRTLLPMEEGRVLIAQTTVGLEGAEIVPAMVEVDRDGVVRWQFSDEGRFPAGLRAALVLAGDPTR